MSTGKTLVGCVVVPFHCVTLILCMLPQNARARAPLQEVTTAFEYDGNGNVVSRVDGNGGRTLYTYDKVNRLSTIDYPGGTTPEVQFAYDGNGNLTSMTDGAGTTRYRYDVLDQLTRIDDPAGNTILYWYDQAGNVTLVACGKDSSQSHSFNWVPFPGESLYAYHVVEYSYDPDNRISSVKDYIADEITAYAYDRAGNLSRCDLPNGCYTLYSYDADGRLVAVEHRDATGGLIVKYEYTLNSLGNRMKVVETTASGSKTTTYAYDVLDRLKTAAYPDGRSVDYECDSFGNRTKMTETRNGTATVTEYSYDSDSRLLATRVNGVEDERFSYDAVGNLIKRVGVRPGNSRQIEYAYDHENRLIRYLDGTNDVTYTYDGLGTRTARTANGQTTRFLNDINRPYAEAIAELDASNMPIRLRGWGTDLVSVREPRVKSSFYLHDSPAGSVRRLVNGSGQTINTYEYDAFGATTAEAETVADTYKFDGEVQEKETGLLFLRARYYDPSTGRFLTRDPVTGIMRRPATLHPYVFAEDDPANKTDASGMQSDATFIGQSPLFIRIGLPGTSTPMPASNGVFNSGEFWRAVFAPWDPWNPLDPRNPPTPLYNEAERLIREYWNRVGSADVRTDVDQFIETGSVVPEPQPVVRPGMPTPQPQPAPAPRPIDADENRRQAGGGPPDGGGGGNQGDPNPQPGPHPPGGPFMGMSYARPGGVDLNRTAEVISEIRDIKGVAYDSATGQLIIYGDKEAALPPMNFDDFVVAARAIFRGFDPVVSIDPPNVACPTNECNQGLCQTVRYGDRVPDPTTGELVLQDLSSGTHFGWVMFEADRMVKCLGLGKDNVTCEPISCSVPGYKSMLTRLRETGGLEGNISIRFWFQPTTIRVAPSPNGKSMVFTEAGMELLTETTYATGGQQIGHPAVEEFAAHFNAHFDEFAEESPVFEDLRQLAKIVGIVKWIKDNGIPLELSLLEKYTPAKWDTPWVTPVTSVEEQWTGSLPGQIVTHTLTLTGGVTYKGEIKLAPPAVGPENTVLASRPAETELIWTVDLPGTTKYSAVAVSLEKQPMDGGFTWADTDLTAHVSGSVPLALTRYYDSFDIEEGPFGWGWRATPYQLQYRGSSFELAADTYRQDGYNQIVLVNHATGSVAEYEPRYFYDRQADDQRVADMFDAQEDILVYSNRAANVPDILLSDGADHFVMRLAGGLLASFDGEGRLLDLRDPSGNRIVYGYDQGGRLVSIGQPGSGRTITLSYDENGRIVQATGSCEQIVTYSYDASGSLVQVTRSRPTSDVAAGHDADDLVPALQGDRTADKITYAYDATHRLIEIRDDDGQALATLEYDLYGRVISTAQAPATDAFVAQYNLAKGTTQTTGPQGYSELREYDANQNLIRWTDSRGNVTSFTYNSRRNLTSVVDAEGNTMKFYYRQDGYPVAVCRPNGRYDAVGRDEQGRVVESFQTSIGSGYENSFDNEHILTSLPGCSVHNLATFRYDEAGRLTQVVDPLGHINTFGYDGAGNVVEARDGRGEPTSYHYDGYSRLIRVADAEGHAVTFEYDDCDNATRISTKAGSVEMAYDARGRLASTTYGDPQERRSRVYGYNAVDQLMTVTSPDGAVTSYAYNERGNLLQITHDGVVRVEYEYDALNRVRHVRYRGTADGVVAN